MNDHLTAAIDFLQNAANCFDRADGDVSERFAEQLRRDGNENIQLSQAAAAIAQAEAAERQAETQESIMALVRRQTEAMEKIANMLAPTISERPYP